MALEKPKKILDNKYMSDKGDEIVADKEFRKTDIPTIALLCQWYAVIDRCMRDIATKDGDVEVAYQNDMADQKQLPQLSTMKSASAEIRALNKQLGINDEVKPKPKGKVTKLEVIRGKKDAKTKNRQTRA